MGFFDDTFIREDDQTSFCLPHAEVAGFDRLVRLALDMRWSWNHSADTLWKKLDPVLWELTHNPWAALQTISREKVERVLSDPAVREELDRLSEARHLADQQPAWFQKISSESPLDHVAYFSMEFMLSEALPIYSGGLGNVAGDQLKAASDLGLPVVGIGLLYQQGYFRQLIDAEGRQQALFPYNEPGQLPISPVRKPNGEWVRFTIDLGTEKLWLRIWKARVGRVWLFLLDTNDLANTSSRRGITNKLYGGNATLRLEQEIVLGIGGWRCLEVLGIEASVCHLNEGHAAFALLERARIFMKTFETSFEEALAATRAGNLFTTHTAVPAGFDRFAPDLVSRFLGSYVTEHLGLSTETFLGMGRQNPADSGEPFNMAYLALRGSGRANGVSRLHGQVSREIFAPLFPRWPVEEVPVGHVTNGVHVPSWDSAEADALWTRFCRKDRWLGTLESMEEEVDRIPDTEIWAFRNASQTSLVEYVRHRRVRNALQAGASARELEEYRQLFDPAVLTIGFARRFATYKRPNLLLLDPERLARLLNHPHRPVQILIAGKAHPQDLAGQSLVHDWIRFMERTDVRKRAVFLVDYDMLLAERMVQGIDLWINTPRRPWEACGTSGMKVLVNGGLNISELDGWWAEAYDPKAGWSIGDGQDHGDDPAHDRAEAEELYDKLEKEIVPLFYERDSRGVPAGWVERIRESMGRLTPRFSANRAVREYTTSHYLPAAESFRTRSENKASVAREIVRKTRLWQRGWNTASFGEFSVVCEEGLHTFTVRVHPGDLPADCFRVELFAGPEGTKPSERHPMEISGTSELGFTPYSVRIPLLRPVGDYTPRLLPFSEGLSVPLEAPWIAWQR